MGDAVSIELFTEYGLGVAILLLRYFARWKVFGFRNFGWDDILCAFALTFWTVDTALIDIFQKYGSAVGLNEETALELTDEEVADFEIGSKCLFVAWMCYISLIWTLKGVLLCLYNRLTLGLWQHRLVKIMMVACVVTWITCIAFHLGSCTPIPRNWQVKPYPGDRCILRRPNYVVVAALNILTDIGILSIPLPILFVAQIPFHRKVILGVLFSSGIFVIVAALLRAVLSLQDIENLATAALWAVRETFVSTVAVSAPAIKPLFNKSSWLKSSSRGTGVNSTTNNKTTDNEGTTRSSGLLRLHNKTGTTALSGPHGTLTTITGQADKSGLGKNQFELTSVGWPRKKQTGTQRLPSDDADAESQEYIVQAGKDDLNIHVTTEYKLEHEGRDFYGQGNERNRRPSGDTERGDSDSSEDPARKPRRI